MRKGQSIVELLIAMGIATVFLPALASGLFASRNGRAEQNQRLSATALLKESEEANRIAREQDWSSVATPGIYHPSQSGNTWILPTGTEVINGFTRSTTISSVYRDANGDIVTSGGILDPAIVKALNTVSWTTPISNNVSSTQYLGRYLTNSVFSDTTASDFNLGIKSSVSVTNTSGGEVLLGEGGYADWCTPNASNMTFDLPKSGVANGISAYEGRILAGTGENSSGVSIDDIAVSDTNPPVLTSRGTFNGYKTNAIFIEGNYGYIATDTNSKEIVIVNLTSPPFTQSGYFNAPGNGNGQSIFVSGNVGYATAGNKFYTFDLSSKTGSRPQLGSLNLAATGTKVVVAGNYAYVSIAGSVTELQIINVGNPSSPTVVGQADVNGQAAVDVTVNSSGTRAYLATNSSPTQREFFIVDTSVKTGNRPTLGSYNADPTSPKAISLASANKVVEIGTGGEEYQVIDVTNEASPVRCGGADIDSGVRGIASVFEADGDAYSYIVTGDTNSELKVIPGGPGGQYALSGTFESQRFAFPSVTNAQPVILNRFDGVIAKPLNTDIKLQIATTGAVGGNCTGVTYNYVGPDGTALTYFTSTDGTTIGAPIPLATSGSLQNPTQCFRYKAYLSTSDKFASPVLYDMNVNYSY
ncbi:hypothetical protein A3D77_01150 [Candidatus Gottesmanbacteria bacterium RIFCSPHIGHO2_02_FULL_39_11]|uniref:Uncharacterized protein n=1 Tax=Candidatus Gottesmanbacteria bacterium RIFCSPHIGHO2_02_FULL_39_11 TaxID=1798382 RepID=A0A1F5ZKA5_9BACT|nr:MAG: hypothetical protein A3D77_01150 [Candidatus Gottesmanbacteria bacterium RIFCSPHIGHO2_02_FULL_39_11]